MADNRVALGKVASWARLIKNSEVVIKVSLPQMADELLRRTKRGFETERDPYGQRWKPKKRPDGRKTLTGKTRRLRSGWRRVVRGKSFVIYPSVEYAAYHQTGVPSRNLVRRRMVPSKDSGMPRAWNIALTIIAMKNFWRHFTGKL